MKKVRGRKNTRGGGVGVACVVSSLFFFLVVVVGCWFCSLSWAPLMMLWCGPCGWFFGLVLVLVSHRAMAMDIGIEHET